jgi:hypothetical protein
MLPKSVRVLFSLAFIVGTSLAVAGCGSDEKVTKTTTIEHSSTTAAPMMMPTTSTTTTTTTQQSEH